MNAEREEVQALAMSPTGAPIGEVIESPPHAGFLPGPGIFIESESDPKLIGHSPDNLIGFNTEQRVARVLARLPYVKQVRQVDHNGEEDARMEDLVLTMVEGFIIPEFYVQVKNSKWGVKDFFDDVGKRMEQEEKERKRRRKKHNRKYTPPPRLYGDIEYERKKEWLAKKRLIVINGGIRDGMPVTEEYIAGKFDREMKEAVRINRLLGLVTVPRQR